MEHQEETIVNKIACWTSVCTGSISTLSSMTIIYLMITDREVKLRAPNNRFLLAMSAIDIIQSVAYALISVPLPKSSGVYLAAGNYLTCNIQAFAIQLGLAVPCYNGCLCIWFLMSTKYNMHPEIFKKKIEPYCHAVSILLPLGLAIILLALGQFDQSGFLCWIGEKKGSYTALVFVLLSVAMPALSFVIIAFSLGSIYHNILLKERRMQQYSTSASGLQWRPSFELRAKKLAARQGLLFSISFMITFLFPGINVLFYEANSYNSPFVLPQALFMPLQVNHDFLLLIYLIHIMYVLLVKSKLVCLTFFFFITTKI